MARRNTIICPLGRNCNKQRCSCAHPVQKIKAQNNVINSLRPNPINYDLRQKLNKRHEPKKPSSQYSNERNEEETKHQSNIPRNVETTEVSEYINNGGARYVVSDKWSPKESIDNEKYNEENNSTSVSSQEAKSSSVSTEIFENADSVNEDMSAIDDSAIQDWEALHNRITNPTFSVDDDGTNSSWVSTFSMSKVEQSSLIFTPAKSDHVKKQGFHGFSESNRSFSQNIITTKETSEVNDSINKDKGKGVYKSSGSQPNDQSIDVPSLFGAHCSELNDRLDNCTSASDNNDVNTISNNNHNYNSEIEENKLLNVPSTSSFNDNDPSNSCANENEPTEKANWAIAQDSRNYDKEDTGDQLTQIECVTLPKQPSILEDDLHLSPSESLDDESIDKASMANIELDTYDLFDEDCEEDDTVNNLINIEGFKISKKGKLNIRKFLQEALRANLKGECFHMKYSTQNKHKNVSV